MQRQTKAVEDVEGRRAREIADAGGDRCGIAREQQRPLLRQERDRAADRADHPGGKQAAGPGDATRARPAVGAGGDADQRQHPGANPVGNRAHKILQPRADGVARQRRRAEAADQTGQHHRADAADHRDGRGGEADAHDFREQAALQTAPAERRHEAQPAAPDRARRQGKRHGRGRDAGRREAREPPAGPATDAQPQQRRQWHVDRRAHDAEPRRQDRVAHAPQDGRREVGRPDENAEAEPEIAVGTCLLQHGALAAHHAVEERRRRPREQRAERGKDKRQQQRMDHQRLGVLAPAAAQRARHGRGDGAAQPARGDVHHHDDEGIDQREGRQRPAAQPPDQPDLGQHDGDLHHHESRRGTGEPQQRTPDGRDEERMGHERFRRERQRRRRCARPLAGQARKDR